MKIEIDLPDYCNERNIYIFAGIEEVARKHKDAPWEVKVSRCSMCGKCCRDLPKSFPFRKKGTKTCKYLVKEVGNNNRWLCDLKSQRPFGCAVGQPLTISECTVRFESANNLLSM